LLVKEQVQESTAQNESRTTMPVNKSQTHNQFKFVNKNDCIIIIVVVVVVVIIIIIIIIIIVMFSLFL